jgi:GNAT superfamily N-acetyltransferase
MSPDAVPPLAPGRSLERVADGEVDPKLDQELRGLLSTCFTKAQDTGFKRQRYWQEPPAFHYLLREADGRVIAHAAVHHKKLGSAAGDVEIGGVGDVCVHPSCRGQGLVKVLLRALHEDLKRRNVPFGMLTGDAKVYGSSGYVPITNPLHYREFGGTAWVTQPHPQAMIRALGEARWPEGMLDLRGPLF